LDVAVVISGGKGLTSSRIGSKPWSAIAQLLDASPSGSRAVNMLNRLVNNFVQYAAFEGSTVLRPPYAYRNLTLPRR
jgi:hypothetical protein